MTPHAKRLNEANSLFERYRTANAAVDLSTEPPPSKYSCTLHTHNHHEPCLWDTGSIINICPLGSPLILEAIETELVENGVFLYVPCGLLTAKLRCTSVIRVAVSTSLPGEVSVIEDSEFEVCTFFVCDHPTCELRLSGNPDISYYIVPALMLKIKYKEHLELEVDDTFSISDS